MLVNVGIILVFLTVINMLCMPVYFFEFSVLEGVGCGESCHRVINFNPWLTNQSERHAKECVKKEVNFMEQIPLLEVPSCLEEYGDRQELGGNGNSIDESKFVVSYAFLASVNILFDKFKILIVSSSF